MRPRVLVVVVTFNSSAHVDACLRSLLAQEGVEVRLELVDNASTDGTLDIVRARFPTVTVHASRENLGFAQANNRVLDRADADWVALVNPDTECPPGALGTCVRFLEQRPGAGVVGLRQQDGLGRDQHPARPFPGVLNVVAEAVGLDRLLAPVPRLGARLSIRRAPGVEHPGRAARVDWLQGSFLVIRGAALRAAGTLDPQYFMYGEDVEWCRRLREAGYAAWYLPDPVVFHQGGASAGAARPALFVESWKGRLRYFDRHRGAVAAALARAATALGILLRAAVCEVQDATLRLSGRGVPVALAQRRALFRSAAAWVASGMPLAAERPPGAVPDRSAS